MKKMHVESEFAPLRSVVLAQSQFCLPDKFDEADTTFLTEENARLTQNNEGRDLADFAPEQQVRWEKEKEVMQGVLESYGVEVFRPRLLTTYEKEHGKELGVGYSNFFSRDPFFYNWQSLNRRKLKISTPSTRNFTNSSDYSAVDTRSRRLLFCCATT